MIEMRVVDNGPMCRPEIQYRCMFLIADACHSGAVYKKGEIWCDWQTAEWVYPEETQNA